MNTRRRTLLGSTLLIVGLVGLAALAIALVMVGGDEPPAPQPDPPVAEPEPEPEPPPPVEGESEVAGVTDLSITGAELVRAGHTDDEPVPVDDDAVDDLVAAITDWLDTHLTDLQEEGEGLVVGVGLDGPPDAGELAGPGVEIASALYTFHLGVRGEPEWVRVEVEVLTKDGGEHRAIFAFTGHEEPELQAVEART